MQWLGCEREDSKSRSRNSDQNLVHRFKKLWEKFKHETPNSTNGSEKIRTLTIIFIIERFRSKKMLQDRARYAPITVQTRTPSLAHSWQWCRICEFQRKCKITRKPKNVKLLIYFVVYQKSAFVWNGSEVFTQQLNAQINLNGYRFHSLSTRENSWLIWSGNFWVIDYQSFQTLQFLTLSRLLIFVSDYLFKFLKGFCCFHFLLCIDFFVGSWLNC